MKTTILKSNFLTAVLTGIAITIAAGLILFPIVYLAFGSLFHLYIFTDPPPYDWINDVLLIIVLCAWVFVAAGAGGWACAGISKRDEYSHALFLAVLWTVIFSLFFLYAANREPVTTLLLIVALGVSGYFAGTALRMRKKRKARQAIR